MKHLTIILFLIIITFNSFASDFNDKKVVKKISYNEYMIQYGENDTAAAIISIYHDKRENSGVGQMSFLPVTASLCIVSPPIGLGLTIISSPLFFSGLITYTKYNHKKLNRVLDNYTINGNLSKKLRKKVVKQLEAEKFWKEDLTYEN